jgi:hypothetical protein
LGLHKSSRRWRSVYKGGISRRARMFSVKHSSAL